MNGETIGWFHGDEYIYVYVSVCVLTVSDNNGT